MSNVAVKPRKGSSPSRALSLLPYEQREMALYGFIYSDGTYSDERQPKGATLVSRRPSEAHFWDPESKEWYVDGDVMPPEGQGGAKLEKVLGENAGRPPTVAEVIAANGGQAVFTQNGPMQSPPADRPDPASLPNLSLPTGK